MQDLVGLAHRLQQRQARAAADVGAQPDTHLPLAQPAQIEQAAAEEHVRRRAMRRRRAAICHEPALLVLQVQAMGKHRSFPHQAETIVNVEVTRTPREQPGNLLDFVVIFGEVSVNPHIRILSRKTTRRLELRLAGR